jgi:phage-related tail fiber protein
MASRKITEYTALTTPANNDVLPIIDVSEPLPENQNKKITIPNLTSQLSAASTSAAGIVQLNDTTSSTSTTEAATANAVKAANDLAAAALPKAGGTMTGALLSPGGAAFYGTVSSSVDGAIIEKGSNANGSFTKFADGTMFVEMRGEENRSTTGVVATTVTYPVAFAALPNRQVTINGTSGTTGALNMFNCDDNSASLTTCRVNIGRSTTTNTFFHVRAFGRWY